MPRLHPSEWEEDFLTETTSSEIKKFKLKETEELVHKKGTGKNRRNFSICERNLLPDDDGSNWSVPEQTVQGKDSY